MVIVLTSSAVDRGFWYNGYRARVVECGRSWVLGSNLGTFSLKIEHFWPFEEISIFSNGGHLGYMMALTDTILKGDHLRIISAKFG